MVSSFADVVQVENPRHVTQSGLVVGSVAAEDWKRRKSDSEEQRQSVQDQS